MKNQDKIILDLCGGTGSWSRPYREAGYDIRNITLPQFDVREVFMRGDGYLMLPMAEEYKNTMLSPKVEKIYGILAAPPCTMFSLARQNAKTPRDFNSAMEIVEACLKIIWICRANGNLKFWALENPTGYLRQFLGKPPFNFKPNEFGDPILKRTDLWGYFNEPKKLKKPVSTAVSTAKGSERQSEWFAKRRKPEDRAVTPQGFARAFFEANK
jgi:hypothetical protein